eukprot:CAMPEP_0118867600 /NCGR_PEP_ID=MMETSP1163-20130328/11152_1 /TAXON_ID=124430 /ORGANISM="Phaeomonas parva, Strain CCMP2877" /LENGTH=590 /DNA_ID=CAMNT_0006802033 /DNA_START=136 /DNA_END=1905 /DNA_ORIENTATION=-
MAAHGFLSTIRGLSRKEQVDAEEDEDFQWGSYKYLNGRNLNKLTRRQLRNHLAARDLEEGGTRAEMKQRLEDSLEEERLSGQAYSEALEAKFLMDRDLEERGSVYTIGTNAAGQLGLGDTTPRHDFETVHRMSGIGVKHVSAGYDTVIAVTEDHDVYIWGGGGVAPTGVEKDDLAPWEESLHMEPQVVETLIGEEVETVSVGASHVAARSRGGDCLTWGYNSAGQLGNASLTPSDVPIVVTAFPDGTSIDQVQVGENHTCAVTAKGRLYVWGHSGDGRLGLGARERVGVPPEERFYFPTPSMVGDLGKERVLKLSCGPSFTLCVTDKHVYSWGSGSGGRLGHGDKMDCASPRIIEAFSRSIVMSVAAGTWHSLALVMIPGMRRCGHVYSWGSGFHGQLGLGGKKITASPQLVKGLADMCILAKGITCGSHHNFVVDSENELYSWGSNTNRCLGRHIDEHHVQYTPVPGHVSGFGTIVRRVGRGLPRSVACGKEFTVVATFPYEGPAEEIAQKLMEEKHLREEEERLKKEEAEAERRRAERRAKKEKEKEKKRFGGRRSDASAATGSRMDESKAADILRKRGPDADMVKSV